jgi:hypothetical protein
MSDLQHRCRTSVQRQFALEAIPEFLSPREALRQLQAEARLTLEQARDYLEELRTERLAAETRRSA